MAAAAAGAAAAVAAAAAPVAQPFALTPAEVDNDPIPYGTTEGKKLYKAATTPLETKFDGESDKFQLFLEDVTQHAEEHNWGPILRIPNNAGAQRSLLHHIGKLTEANIRDHESTFINAQNSRDAQRTTQMYYFIYHSLESDIRKRVTNERSRYIITINDREYYSGPLLLKAIAALVQVDTASVVADVHAQLHSLDSYMRTKVDDCNIEKFNTHFRDLRTVLSNRSETLNDTQLNLHLFKGYSACSDTDFLTFVMNLKNQVLYQGMTLSPDEIMTLSLRYYTDKVRREEWNKGSPDHEQIIALTAELQSIKGRDNKGKKGKKKGKDGKHKKGDKKGNNKKMPKWRTTPPKDGESTTKVVNDKTVHWCANHKQWVAHTTASCKGINTDKKRNENDNKDKKDL